MEEVARLVAALVAVVTSVDIMSNPLQDLVVVTHMYQHAARQASSSPHLLSQLHSAHAGYRYFLPLCDDFL